MPKATIRKFSAADEKRSFRSHGYMELIRTGEGAIGRAVFEPGWKWSTDVKPIAGTESCEVHHRVYVLSGRMHIAMDDGDELDIGPGDLVDLPPGHDGWTIGDEPCVLLDFAGMMDYARAGAGAAADASEPGAMPFHEGA